MASQNDPRRWQSRTAAPQPQSASGRRSRTALLSWAALVVWAASCLTGQASTAAALSLGAEGEILLGSPLLPAAPRGRGRSDPSSFPRTYTSVTQPIPLTAPDGFASHSPTIAADPSGNYCIAWVDERDGNKEIYFLKVASSGSSLVGPLNVSQTPGASIDPEIAVDAAGNSHVCWQEGASNGEGAILLSRVDSQGHEYLNNLTVSSSFSTYPAVTATASGETWVGFRRREVSLYPIFSAKVSAAGVKSCERRAADNSLLALDNSISIDWNSSGQVIATYHDVWNFQEFAGLQVWSGSCAGGCAGGCGSRCQWFSSNALEHTSLTSPSQNLVYLVFENDPGTGRGIYSLTGCNAAVLLSDTPGPAMNPNISTPEGVNWPLVVWEDHSGSISEIRLRDANRVSPSAPISIGVGNSSMPDIAVKDLTHWAATWQNSRAGAPEIYLAGTEVPATPPFEIVSVTADSALYENGADVAYVNVVLRSNWGSSDLLSLSLELEHYTGSVPISAEGFALFPGGQHMSSFSWPVPAYPHFRAFDAHIRLYDGGALTLERVFPDVVATAPLPDAVLQKARDQITACAPPGVGCVLAIAGLVPVAGDAATLASLALDGCEVLAAWEAGDACRFGVSVFSLVMDAVDIALDAVIPVPVTPAQVAWSGLDATVQCALDLADPCPGGSAGAAGIMSVADMDTLASNVLVTWDSLGRGYSNEIFAHGAARISVLADSAVATADSLGMDDCWLLRLPISDISWAHVGPSPTRFGNPVENTHAALVGRFEATGNGPVTVLILHRGVTGNVMRLEYPAVSWSATGVAWIPLSDMHTSFPMSVDYEGDGTIDETIYPTRTVRVDESPVVRFAIGVPRPNPGRSPFAVPVAVPAPGGWLTARVVDVRGREVVRFASAWLAPGVHPLRWNGLDKGGRAVPSGTYCVMISFQGETRTAKVTVLR